MVVDASCAAYLRELAAEAVADWQLRRGAEELDPCSEVASCAAVEVVEAGNLVAGGFGGDAGDVFHEREVVDQSCNTGCRVGCPFAGDGVDVQ